MIELDSLTAITDKYDLFIIDIWGVLHNGRHAFPEAIAALQFLKATQKNVLLLSNSPRRLANNKKQLASLGITTDLYTSIYTSGEDCYQNLQYDPFKILKESDTTFYFIGLERDHDLLVDLSKFKQVEDINAAHFILCTGTQSDIETADHYMPLLKIAKAKDLPFLCVNPDLEVVLGSHKIYCAGAIAALYQTLDGRTHYFGKPFPDFYQTALKGYAEIPRSRILAIGDALRTDILGACLQGIDSLLVMSGIQDKESLAKKIISPVNGESLSIFPTYTKSNFSL